METMEKIWQGGKSKGIKLWWSTITKQQPKDRRQQVSSVGEGGFPQTRRAFCGYYEGK